MRKSALILLTSMCILLTACGNNVSKTEKAPSQKIAETTTFAKNEQNDNARPALTNHIEDIDSYSKIYIVYPNWWGKCR